MFSKKNLVNDVEGLLRQCLYHIPWPSFEVRYLKLSAGKKFEELTALELLRERALLLTLLWVYAKEAQVPDDDVKNSWNDALMCCMDDIPETVKGDTPEPEDDIPF
jgi:hypothetical protein